MNNTTNNTPLEILFPDVEPTPQDDDDEEEVDDEELTTTASPISPADAQTKTTTTKTKKKKKAACVVRIAYSPEFKSTMGYFRTIMKTNELSERALELTLRVIELNPANYTAWHYRRRCLYATNADLRRELDFVGERAMFSPKNYQIWYHRRALVEKLKDGSREQLFTRTILETDAKNYHAWAHRQWAVSRFHLFDAGEMEYVNELINIDVRNNSAWSHRWFVLTQFEVAKASPDRLEALVRREVEYCKAKARLAPRNECPYSFLQALSRYWPSSSSSSSSSSLTSWGVTRGFVEAFDLIAWLLSREILASTPPAVPARSLLIDCLVCVGKFDEAREECARLAIEFDSTRNRYWLSRSYEIPLQ